MPHIWTRRDLLKVGAGFAALSLLGGCGTGVNGPSARVSTTTASSTPLASSGSLNDVVRVSIHPSIGVARVGNSADFFLGPEVSGPTPEPTGGFRDTQGALKRQGARFRVYGFDAAGALVTELTSADAVITWQVHLANKKAAWYDFNTALDVPVADPTPRRNPSVVGAQRDALVIDGGLQQISGTNQSGVKFDLGQFMGTVVPLGELQTDEAGRLIVLGGYGNSFSPSGMPLTTFANNVGWCDDTSDGPVRATVQIGSRILEADTGWVVVAPPNYGPSIAEGYVTMYDIVRDVMVRSGMLPAQPVSLALDIQPLFSRLVDMQWLNAGILRDNGPGTSGNYLDANFQSLLQNASPSNAIFRNNIFSMFRNPTYPVTQAPPSIPNMYGDEVSIPATTPQQWMAVTHTQYATLSLWAAGQFDEGPASATPASIEAVPLPLQPAELDRASLSACLGGAFHPGCEATWPLRIASMYASPFRFRALAEGTPEVDYGDLLTPSAALASNGPLSASAPGDITRWMAVPWQSDTASCRSGYQPGIDPYLPTFWPARVPNHVLTSDSYAIVMNTSLPSTTRLAAFHQRDLWLRNIVSSDAIASLTRMVADWFMLGLVTEQPGATDLGLPATFKVEVANTFTTPPISTEDVSWGLED